MNFTRLDLLYYIVPILLLVLLFRWRRKRHFLGHPVLLQYQAGFSRSSRLVYLPLLFQWAALAFLMTAVLNPVLSFAEEQIQMRGLDIVLVLDLSASMNQALPVNAAEAARLAKMDPFFAKLGVNPSRLDAVKIAVKNFIRQRKNDRVGLVVFSSNAYVVSPMTLDYDYLTHYVDMLEFQTLIGEGMTAIGEGIYTASNLLVKQNKESRGQPGDKLLIVLTDGENNYGRNPIEAVQYLKEKHFKIYMIGVDVPLSSFTHNLISAIRSAGGNYYDVRNQQQLNHAYWEIGALEKGDFVVKQYQRSVPYYHQAVAASFVCLALALSLRGLSFFTDLS